MRYEEVSLKGAYLFQLDASHDHRGSFTRIFCRQNFKAASIDVEPIVQTGISFNAKKGTLRGMHYQIPPHGQEKWVFCSKGSIFDVILDLRPDSLTFGKHYSVTLSANQPTLFFIPKGFAHGFLTLEDQTEIFYQLSQPQSIEHERTIRWNDLFFEIKWPFLPLILSDKDRMQTNFNPQYHLSQ